MTDAMTQHVDWAAIAPPLALVVAGVVALLVDAFLTRFRAQAVVAVGAVGVLVGLGTLLSLRGETRGVFCLGASPGSAVDCSWLVDHVSLVWWFAMLGSTGLILLLVAPSLVRDELPAGEAVFLLLSSAAGAMSVAAAGDLITLVVAMETVSLPAFALVGLRRRDRRGAEAALKFFVVSVVATAVTLLGISLVYGATGSVAAGGVAVAAVTDSAIAPVLQVGLMLTLVGLGFKVAAVPFQAWVPDTYVGAPIPIAAYLSVVSKAAGIAGVIVVVDRFAPTERNVWGPAIGVAAALTMTVGNVAALRQRHAVRLLAWSSVAQAGYLLVPIAAGGSPSGVGSVQAYLIMYAVVNLAAFAVVLAWSAHGATTIDDFGGLVRRSPWLGVALVFALLCLAGLPPGVVGLLAKVVIFQAAVDGSYVWLAIVMAVNVAIGLVYYLRFLVIAIKPAADETKEPLDVVPWPISLVIVMTTVAAVALSVVPGPLFSVIQ